ncbi:MAG: hypothetical protein K0B07_02335 [DPANN group archaeon]|nr:hypothetical protein [DPANN group archaeon]
MRKAMTQSISLITVIVVGLFVVAILIVMVGDKMGKASDVIGQNTDITEDSLECKTECSACCATGYGGTICARQFIACDCSC